MRSAQAEVQHHRRSFRRTLARLSLYHFITLITLSPAFSQEKEEPLTRMLFVFDASNSMNAFWGGRPKIETARELLLTSLKELEGKPNLELALRLYGHQTPIKPGQQDCDDTKLEVPFSNNSIPEIRNTLRSVRCLGTTPIARSLEKAAGDFPSGNIRSGDQKVRNVIILITDGIEACDEDPCAVSRALQAKGIVLKPFVIGVGLEDADKYNLQCVGNYYDASTPELFEQVLKVVVTQALNTTTAQVSLMTEDKKPTETDVPVTFYDQKNGQVRYHFVHTMNDRGIPDTLSIDPIFTYKVVAHTIPPSIRENVTVKPGEHTIIAVDAGMGTLNLKMGNGPPDAFTFNCIIRRKGDKGTLHVQDVGTQQRLRVGTYDLEVLTLPRLQIPDVKIDQGKTTDVSIPRPGVLNVITPSPGSGAIFERKGDELVWVVDLDPAGTHMQYRLLPGKYQVVYRSRNARRTELSITKDVSIESNRAEQLNF
jgi:Ca-activated chloride channel family protein